MFLSVYFAFFASPHIKRQATPLLWVIVGHVLWAFRIVWILSKNISSCIVLRKQSVLIVSSVKKKTLYNLKRKHDSSSDLAIRQIFPVVKKNQCFCLFRVHFLEKKNASPRLHVCLHSSSKKITPVSSTLDFVEHSITSIQFSWEYSSSALKYTYYRL